MSLIIALKPRKSSPDSAIVEFDYDDNVITPAFALIEDTCRKLKYNGLNYDLRTIDFQLAVAPEATMYQYQSTIGTTFTPANVGLKAAFQKLHKSKAVFFVGRTKYDLRTFDIYEL